MLHRAGSSSRRPSPAMRSINLGSSNLLKTKDHSNRRMWSFLLFETIKNDPEIDYKYCTRGLTSKQIGATVGLTEKRTGSWIFSTSGLISIKEEMTNTDPSLANTATCEPLWTQQKHQKHWLSLKEQTSKQSIWVKTCMCIRNTRTSNIHKNKQYELPPI